MRRIAVMPFENSFSGGQDIANHLTQDAISRLTGTGHFTIISAAEVDRLRRSGESLANHVDAVLTGRVMNIQQSGVQSHTTQLKNKDGSTSTYTIYTLEVALEVSYSLERTRDGSLLGTTSRTATAKDTQGDPGRLKSVSQLLRQCNVLRGLVGNMAPHTVKETRMLMNEKTGDKVLREQMKSAAAHVTQRSYKAALDAYMKIYEETNSFAAAYNASMMLEALRNTRAALDLMHRAAQSTGNPTAQNEIARLNKQLQNQETLETEHRGAVRPIEKTTAYALNEAQSHLPSNARVWIINNSATERELASAVIDNMTAMFMNAGITIVDREHTQLIERELRQQFSGSVGDNDILKAGKLAGANTIIIIAVSGVGSMRRLQMRILDVERGVPLLQSGTDSNWEL